MTGRRFDFRLVIALALSFASVAAHALSIHFDFSSLDARTDIDEQTKTNVRAGYVAGAKRWEQAFSDTVTIEIRADFGDLNDTSGIARTTTSVNRVSYSQVRAALVRDSRSAVDALAVAHMPSAAFGFRYLENPIGSAEFGEFNHFLLSTIAYQFQTVNDGLNVLNEDNEFLSVSTANLKALGLVPRYGLAFDTVPAIDGVRADGAIALSRQYAYDFEADDGIAPAQFDFAGVVAHEIGHVLGINSGADVLDSLTGQGACREFGCGFVGPAAGTTGGVRGVGDDWGWHASVLDLFRYSSLSFSEFDGHFLGFDLTSGLAASAPLTLDRLFTEDLAGVPRTAPYFSIDGGRTRLGLFGTGIYNGIGLRINACEDPTSGEAFATAPQTMCPDGTVAFQVDLPPDSASHWVDSVFSDPSLGLPFGLMDAAREGPGVRERFTALDFTAFDAIGWDLAVPAPGGAPAFAIACLIPWLARRRAR